MGTLAPRSLLAILLTVALLGPVGPPSFTGASARAQPADTSAAQALEELKQDVDSLLTASPAPGAGIAVVEEDSIVWTAGLGLADRAEGRPATSGTVFRVGSISKTFVSLTAMILREDGQIALSDQLRDLAPDLAFENPWAESHPIRIVHLLEHTSGWDDIHMTEYAYREPGVPLREALAYHTDSRVSRWPPGRRYSYSNAGPAAAARAFEEVTGRTYGELLRERVLDPLEMDRAALAPTDSVAPHLARGYLADGSTEVAYAHLGLRPSGGLNASPREFAHLLQLLLHRGTFRDTTLLPPSAVRRMERPTTTHAARAGVEAGYGLGIRTDIHEGFLFYGHDGGIDGFVADYGYLPETGRGYAVMVNAQTGGVLGDIVDRIRTYLTRDLTPPEPPRTSLDEDQLEAWTGYYQSVESRPQLAAFIDRLLGVVQVERAGDTLSVRPITGGAARLVPVTDSTFRSPDDPVATLLFHEEGDGDTILQGASSALSGTYRRISPMLAWTGWIGALGCILLMASALLDALFWIPARSFGWIDEVSCFRARILSFGAVVALIGAVAALGTVGGNALIKLGTPTVHTIGFFAGTVAFALLTLAGLAAAVRSWRDSGSAWVRLYATAVAAANTVVLMYLAYWDIVGLRLWAY